MNYRNTLGDFRYIKFPNTIKLIAQKPSIILIQANDIQVTSQ